MKELKEGKQRKVMWAVANRDNEKQSQRIEKEIIQVNDIIS